MTERKRPATLPADSGQGMRVLSYLIAGPLAYGAIGWALDTFLLHTGFLLPIGIVVGMALSVFLIMRRFGGSA